MDTVTDEHPQFGNLPIVHDRSKVTKTERVIHRVAGELNDSLFMDAIVGPSTHLRETIAVIISGISEVIYYVCRDEVFRTQFRLHDGLGATVPAKLSGLYSNPVKAFEDVQAYYAKET